MRFYRLLLVVLLQNTRLPPVMPLALPLAFIENGALNLGRT